MEYQTHKVEAQPVNRSKIKSFLRVMWYLAAITAFEFLIAFTVPHEYRYIRVIVFVALTILKAYYIVSEFMHLGHERRSLKLSVILPMLFVVFLLFILIFQGNAIYNLLH